MTKNMNIYIYTYMHYTCNIFLYIHMLCSYFFVSQICSCPFAPVAIFPPLQAPITHFGVATAVSPPRPPNLQAVEAAGAYDEPELKIDRAKPKSKRWLELVGFLVFFGAWLASNSLLVVSIVWLNFNHPSLGKMLQSFDWPGGCWPRDVQISGTG